MDASVCESCSEAYRDPVLMSCKRCDRMVCADCCDDVDYAPDGTIIVCIDCAKENK